MNAKGKTIENLRFAFEFCGYDLDEIMRHDSKRRYYADRRAVAWCIYQEELHRTCGQIGRAFGWNYSTVYCGILRAKRLLSCDRDFSNLYDSIYSVFKSRS